MYWSTWAPLLASSGPGLSQFSGSTMTSVKSMISATTVYDHMPVLTPDEATDMVVDAVIHKPKRIATHLGIFLQVMTAVAPKFSEVLMNTVFRMFNDSAAARGAKQEEQVQDGRDDEELAEVDGLKSQRRNKKYVSLEVEKANLSNGMLSVKLKKSHKPSRVVEVFDDEG